MHIAYLTPEFPHKRTGHAGGMGTSIKNLAEQVAIIGHKVSVFIYGQNRSEVFTEKGITFHKIEKINYPIGGFYFYRKHIESYINLNCDTVDIIEAPDWTGITAFMNLKKPLVIRFHGSDTYFCHIEKRPQKKKNFLFEKWAVKKAQAYIAPTTFAGEKSVQLFKADVNKLKIIPYGLQLEKFVNNNPDQFTAFNILNIGTIIRKKGLFQLAQIFNEIHKSYPKSTLTLIGSDSADVSTGSNSTWELVKQTFSPTALLNVTYKGKVPYNQTQDLIKKAHICVFPSLAETLGMVTIESMALKKAVVNTNIGWAQDLIEHGHDGYMHHPDDIESFIKSITKLFESKDTLLNVAINARKTVESKFDIKKIASKNLAFYKSVIENLN
ncbi:glycosyltransferase family 4 protein [Nonlabens sp. SCSIO 43208]|uniref:glycosyltransferase family 4 protein n=1 Tax=Nonlabens sp. SCSIO 43208 TaxID=2793009 RepID=UPI003D6AF11B